MSENVLGELISLLFLSLALGMDAFSVSLGLGMQQLRLKRIAIIGLAVGCFHIIMPFAGIIVGQVISTKIGDLTVLAGGLLLVAIGAQMVFSAFNNEAKKLIQPIGFGLIIFSLSVSLDSFSVGLSLGLSGVKIVITVILFGVTSLILTWAGLLIGRKARGLFGSYTEILGGSILCSFGLYIIFG